MQIVPKSVSKRIVPKHEDDNGTFKLLYPPT